MTDGTERRSRALTLVELLVVIAIIGLDHEHGWTFP